MNDYFQSAGPSTDGFAPNSSPFLPIVNEPPPQQTFHFNPAITNQPTAPIFAPNATSDFVHHPNAPTNEPLTRKLVTPPPPVVKGPIPSEHQIIQDTFDLLVTRCQQATQQLPLKRKLDDVKKKLDVLYDKLRENRVNLLLNTSEPDLLFFFSSLLGSTKCFTRYPSNHRLYSSI